MLTAPNALKIACLEELGSAWLMQIICDDHEDYRFAPGTRDEKDIGQGTPIAMGTSNAAGEQVDLLNAVEEDSKGSGRLYDDDEDDALNMSDSIGPLSKSEAGPQLTPAFARRSHDRAGSDKVHPSSIKDPETKALDQARTDDLAVQKEGLDLVRNLICGSGASEMIDHVLRELGQDKLFDMLAAKLRPKILTNFHRDRHSTDKAVRHVPPQPEIITSVCYIFVHIAAGHPRHRQLLIAQTELLKLVVPLFTHAQRDIRVCCAWIVINLTWVDDQSDHLHCKARAQELMKLGVYEKLEALEADPELDVRERTKTAIHQMRELLR